MSPRILNQEKRIQDALSALERQDYLTVAAAARAHEIPESTLRHRVAGRSGYMERPRKLSQQLLTPLEEEALVDWCKQLFKWGFPPRIDHLIRMAEILLQRQSTTSTTPPRLSKDWYKRFLKRHDELRTVFSRQVENKRARAHDVSTLNDYFDLHHREKLLKDIKDKDTHNMDEKGFLIGYAAGARIIIPRSSKARFLTH